MFGDECNGREGESGERQPFFQDLEMAPGKLAFDIEELEHTST